MLIAVFPIFLPLASANFLIALHYIVCLFSCFLPVKMYWYVSMECIANVNLAATTIQFLQRNCSRTVCFGLLWLLGCSVSYW